MLSFKQFEFPPVGQNSNNPFDPSRATKKFWLYTKKNELNFGITLPGLCETTGYSTQMLAFFGILVLEIIPTIYGVAQGLLWEAVAAAIFVDIFLAIVAHLWHRKIILSKSQLVNTYDNVSKQNLRRIIKACVAKSNFFYFLIFLSGCAKAFLFYKAYVYLDAVVIGVIVCYLLGAVLHITYTGYFLYTSRFYWFLHNEYRIYLDTNQVNRIGKYSVNQIISQTINTNGVDVKFVVTKQGLHSIVKNSDNSYRLDTLGVMTDKELSGFVESQQNPIAMDIVARAGLIRQLLNLGEINAGAVSPVNNDVNSRVGVVTPVDNNSISNN